MNSPLDFDRFHLNWRHCLVETADDQSEAIYQSLVSAYREPQRFYHTLDHIEHCLLQFDRIRDQLQFPELLELVIWFHDYIFQPGAKDNELLSAEAFSRLTKDNFGERMRETGYRHIMATRHEGSTIDNTDRQYLVDIDLSSFGLPWSEFMRDNDNLRREMGHVSNEDYYRQNARFQRHLLGRTRIFETDYFFETCESRARQNINKYLESIGQQSAPDQ